VISPSKRSEELRLYNLDKILTVSNPGLKAISSKASSGQTVHSLGVITGLLERWSQGQSNGTNVVSQLANFFMSSTLHSSHI
jgi:hypothetical protein